MGAIAERTTTNIDLGPTRPHDRGPMPPLTRGQVAMLQQRVYERGPEALRAIVIRCPLTGDVWNGVDIFAALARIEYWAARGGMPVVRAKG